MTDFWGALTPWLIMAVFLPAAIVLSLKIMPSDEWAEMVIREWADSQGLRVAAIDDARWFDRLFINTHKVYRVRVLDKKGCARECKAVVGPFLLRRTYRNISITWIKAR